MSSRTSTRTPVRGRGRVVKRRARGGTSGRRKGSRVVTATAVPEELVNQESDANIMAVAGAPSITLSHEMKNILTQGQTQASSLSTAMKKAYNSLVKTAVTNSDEIGVTTWEVLSKALFSLFDPEGGYVILKDQILALLGYFGKPLKEKDIPSAAKPHVVLLRGNLTEGQKTLEKIEKGITELLEFIDNCLRGDLTNLTTELKRIKFKQNTINSDLRVCKMYTTTALEELREVEKAVDSNILLGVFGAVGVICAGAACALPVAAVLGTEAMTAGASYTATATLMIVKIVGDYAKWLTDFKNEQLPKLKMLNQKIKECEERIALAKNQVKVLKEDE